MRIYFAPMEGITDGVLRRVHQQIFGGVDIYGLAFHKLTQSVTLTTREKRDVNLVENKGLAVLPQALTRDPNQLLIWLDYISSLGYTVADLNLGCPSPTVTRRGRGSGMLRDPEYLQTFLDCVFAHSLPIRLSVKTRIGYESVDEWPRLLNILSEYPFDHTTIHVRTMREQYTGGIHPEAFEAAIQKGITNLVYNGDLRTGKDVAELITRCPETEAIMIGRGLLVNPALARELGGGAGADKDELETWYMSLYNGWKERFGHTTALGRIKKLMEWSAEGDIQKKRLLRRADTIEECIRAVMIA